MLDGENSNLFEQLFAKFTQFILKNFYKLEKKTKKYFKANLQLNLNNE